MRNAEPRTGRTPAPPLPPLLELEATHRELMLALEQMAQLVHVFDNEGSTAALRASARSIVRFFAEVGHHHHAEEERHVFPDLLASDDVELVQHVRRLQQDHGWLEEDWRELGPQFDAIAAGIGGVDLDTLRSSVEVFSQLYREHIALEESLIYPEARRRAMQEHEHERARRSSL
jgi:hemerythrin-like domain-containing protein